MSVSLMQLWLPIVLGGVFCWVASALIHMLIKYHNSDYQKLSNEEQVAEALGQCNPKPGIYHMPHCVDMSEMNDKSMQDKMIKGPVAMVSVFKPGLPAMGKLLMQQLVFFIVGCFFIAYVASIVLMPAAEFKEVFRFVMIVSFLTYGYGVIPYSIWFGHPWSVCVKYLIDALIYASVVAAVFAWLWPAAQ